MVSCLRIAFSALCLLTSIGWVMSGSSNSWVDVDSTTFSPPCDSYIYCHGPLIDKVQMASIFPDSKTFVDMKLKQSPNITLSIFEKLMNETNNQPKKNDIKKFLAENFEKPGQEFEEWDPSDWKPNPLFIKRIRSPLFKNWASALNALWKILGRKMIDDVKVNKDLYSIIWVPNPVIVPGGRFREFYYWDSYWIIKGLLLSEMTDTAKGMLQNFLSIVDQFGFIPNGGRIYYAMRSQPPLLIPMVKAYVDATNDIEFRDQSIDTLEKEFHFWMANHTVDIDFDGSTYKLAVYKDQSSGPRPESYREDVLSAGTFKTEKEKHAYYNELKAAAESGWDFSSRWFIVNGTNKGNLTNLQTRSIVPVDLNSMLYMNARILSDFFTELNNTKKAIYYSDIASKWLEAVTKVLWHEEVGAWLDYDALNQVKRDYFYPTNIAPLWTGCYDLTQKDKIAKKVIKYLERANIIRFTGGVPTTLEHSGEQWDYPNAWPPLQYMMIMGLDSTGNNYAQRLAYELTQTWVRSNFKAFNLTEAMYEKYDATQMGGHGGGGEYELQIGFGWTNGIIMELLDKYGQTLEAEDAFTHEYVEHEVSFALPSPRQMMASTSPVVTGLFVLAVSLAAGFIGVVIYKRRSTIQDLNLGQRLLGGSQGRYTELRSIHRMDGGNTNFNKR